MPVNVDRVFETSTSTGAGQLAVNGPPPGYRSFFAALGLDGSHAAVIEAVDEDGVPTGQWEICDVVVAGASLLTRSTLHSSSTGARVDFAAGTKRVFAHIRSVVAQDLNYTHSQLVPSATWTVAHNLGKFTNPDVYDSAGDRVVGEVRQVDANSLTITFASAFAGVAYCN